MDQPAKHAAVTPGKGISSSTGGLPLTLLRLETMLSRFPVHLLAEQGRIAIHITQRNARGEVILHWDVSYNDRYGPPRQLAYKLDTLVVNRHLDALGRPLPPLIRLGSFRQVSQDLGVRVGQTVGELKRAFYQNAGTYITAKLTYPGRDGTARRLEAGFTRYSVLFIGERLPTGQRADAVYLVLHDPYREVLNHASVRPLDYDYLKALAPAAQRFYELVSSQVFAALLYGHSQATYRYAEYCIFAPPQRYHDFDRVKKQMYQIHRPHLASGYLARVHFAATVDTDGAPDWVMVYTPGPRARAAYASFMRRPGDGRVVPAAPVPDPDAPALRAPGPKLPGDGAVAPAVVLVRHFYRCFCRCTPVNPPARALAQATALIAAHGEAAAQFVVDFAHQAAKESHYQPRYFGGILRYVPDALQAYARRQARVTRQRAAERESRQRARYEAVVQQEAARLRTTTAPADLATLEATVRAQLIAAGETPVFALNALVRVQTDTILAERAGIPPFDAWQRAQEAYRGDGRLLWHVPLSPPGPGGMAAHVPSRRRPPDMGDMDAANFACG